MVVDALSRMADLCVTAQTRATVDNCVSKNSVCQTFVSMEEDVLFMEGDQFAIVSIQAMMA